MNDAFQPWLDEVDLIPGVTKLAKEGNGGSGIGTHHTQLLAKPGAGVRFRLLTHLPLSAALQGCQSRETRF